MPDQGSTRYEQHDHPGFVAEMNKLCPSCKLIYLNADADVSKQQQQFNSAIAQGAKVIVLDGVDSAASASLVHNAQSQGVKVIAYDRPIPDGKVDFYVSFDNEGIGKAIAASLVEHLKAIGAPTDGVGVLQINGSPTDAAAGLIKKGCHEGLETGAVQDSGRVRHAELDADQRPAVGGGTDRPLRQADHRRRGGERRNRRRRHRSVQGGRR